jgi:hypothetical protein
VKSAIRNWNADSEPASPAIPAEMANAPSLAPGTDTRFSTASESPSGGCGQGNNLTLSGFGQGRVGLRGDDGGTFRAAGSALGT